MEIYDDGLLGSIRNPDGIWINTQAFREPALHFIKHGYYNADPWGSPAWLDYWAEQRNRCIKGYSVGGVKITGDHYQYLNFCPIQKVEDATKKKSKKITSFPDFWDGDYNYFWVREIARNGLLDSLDITEDQQREIVELDDLGQALRLKELYLSLHLEVKIEADCLNGGYNLIVGKSRRKGYSYKNASVAVNNFYTQPNSLTIFNAYEKKFLYPKGIMTMATNYIDFINSETGWTTPSDEIRRIDHIRASYLKVVNDVPTPKGLKSELLAATAQDNPDVNRGKDARDIIIEEAGAFGTPGLLKALYAASQDCVMAGDIKTGMITIFGCVCKDTKVWNHKGKLVNIQDISKESGIIGYASRGVINENISWLKPPAKKECVRITTDKGYTIECSKDHPLLWTKRKYFNYQTKNKKATFKLAENVEVGDILLQSLQMPVFGKNKMWKPRLVGMLIGDGYYGGKGYSAQLAVSEPEILKYLQDENIKYTVYGKKSCDKPFFRYITIQACQAELRLLGLQGQSKKKKRLPANIWDYNKKSVAQLLGGYFDADGYINAQGKRKRITLTSTVKELLEEVKIQLYKFSIQANIYERKHNEVQLNSNVNKKSYTIHTPISYSLEICDLESIRNFKKHIHFVVKHKQDLLNSWDLSVRKNEEVLNYEYEHTIEKGEFFKHHNILENLKGRKVVKVEDIGMQDVYNLTADYTHTYITNGFISHNTSGDMEAGTVDYADMFSKPRAFGLMAFKNIWDKGLEEQSVGFFHPVNWNMEGYYDVQGNSDVEGAKKVELDARQKLIDNGATSVEIQQRMQEKPLGPAEAFAMVSSNNFPVVELKRQLELVKAKNWQKTRGTLVDIVYENGKAVAKPILNGKREAITSLHNLPLNKEGCIVMYEQAVGSAPRGLYKIGYDPVRQDKGTSLAGLIVYKSVHTATTTKNIIVAEYIGRTEDPEDIDRIAERLADYYNTTIMHENEVTSVKNYFRRNKRLSLLAKQPDLVISKNVKTSKVARVYGCHMTDGLKDAGERYIKQWLIEVVDYDENGTPITNINKIYSTRLLEELIAYNRKGNFDLISSLIMCMFQVQEEQLGIEHDDNPRNKRTEELLEMMQEVYKNN